MLCVRAALASLSPLNFTQQQSLRLFFFSRLKIGLRTTSCNHARGDENEEIGSVWGVVQWGAVVVLVVVVVVLVRCFAQFVAHHHLGVMLYVCTFLADTQTTSSAQH